MEGSIARRLVQQRFIVIAVAAGLLYWTLEAALDASVFFSDSFIGQLVNPSLHELWMRSIGVAFIVGLGIMAQLYTLKTGRLNRVLDALRSVNQTALRADDTEILLGEVCKTLVEKQGYYNTWIALKNQDGTFETACAAEVGTRFQRMKHGLKAGILPPCGEQALSRTGVVVAEDPPSECEKCPLAGHYAGRAGLASRLAYGGRAYGFICASVPARYADDEQEHDLFEEMADDIAFALHDIDVEHRRKQAQAKMQKFKSLADNAGYGIALLDADERLDYVNHTFAEMHGYAPDELIGRHFTVLHSEESAETVKQLYQQLGEAGQSATAEVQRKRKDGSTFPAIKHVTVVRSESGRPQCVADTVVDISKRKQAEAQLKKERDKAQQYLDVAGVMFVALDTSGEVTLANKKACDILGYDEDEIRGRNWFDSFIPERIRADVKAVYRDLLDGDIAPVEQYENPIMTKDGDERVILWANTVIRDSDGNIVRTLSSGEDITERKQAEEEMERALEKEQVFKLKTAHHFFNPIAISRGYMEMALEDMPDGTAAEIRKAREALMRVQTVVQNIVQRGEIHE